MNTCIFHNTPPCTFELYITRCGVHLVHQHFLVQLVAFSTGYVVVSQVRFSLVAFFPALDEFAWTVDVGLLSQRAELGAFSMFKEMGRGLETAKTGSRESTNIQWG
jgi:hypothetical protein